MSKKTTLAALLSRFETWSERFTKWYSSTFLELCTDGSGSIVRELWDRERDSIDFHSIEELEALIQ